MVNIYFIFYEFRDVFLTISYIGIFCNVLVLIWRKNLVEKVNQQSNIWWNNWGLLNWQSGRTRLKCDYDLYRMTLFLLLLCKAWNLVIRDGATWKLYIKCKAICHFMLQCHPKLLLKIDKCDVTNILHNAKIICTSKS